MSLSTQNFDVSTQINASLLEKVLINNDLSSLSSFEKVSYLTNVCKTIGLNPVTKPIQLMKFQGKEIPYFTKDASEQLRKINKVSITKIDTKVHDGGLYVVTAYAMTPDGRKDSSTGAIVIGGLKGDALANALMKAETKAKRRVTLSICGLGFIDECEVESIPNAKKIDIEKIDVVEKDESYENLELEFSNYMYEIENSKDMSELKTVFDSIKRMDFRNNLELLKKLIDAKDIKKRTLMFDKVENEIDHVVESTGEVIN